jgi:hypothetical protein
VEARKKEGGIEPKSKAARLWRTVRQGTVDCPHPCCELSGLSRGPSAKANRTTRTNPRKTDRLRRPGGPSAWVPDRPLLKLGPSANQLNENLKPNQIEGKDAQEHDEHATNTQPADRPPPPHGPSASHKQSRKLLDLEGQLPQIIIGFPKRLKLWRRGFGDFKSVTQG